VLAHSTVSFAAVDEVRARHRAVDAYDQRALLMAERDDLVAVQGAVDRDYVDHLDALGVGPGAANIIALGAGAGHAGSVGALLRDDAAFARLARQVRGNRPVRIEPFVAGPRELELARRLGDRLGREVSLLGDPLVVEWVNRKDMQRRWAQELGVPLAEGEVVTLEPDPSGRPRTVEPLRSAVERRLRKGHRALLRGCEGASGSATRIVTGTGDLADAVDWAAGRNEATYLVDRLHEVRMSPNVLVFVPPEPDRPVHFVAATDQILDTSLGHAGNRFPSRAALLDEMVAHAELFGRRLRKEGYAGWVGCDFCEHRDPATGAPRLFFAELNARVNGACYPVALAARWHASGGPMAAFVSGFVQTGARSFAEFADQLGQRLLRLGGRPGVLPYNTGCLAHGYCAVVVLAAEPKAARQRWDELASPPSGHDVD
jgi:hypothetical protein